MRLTGRFGEVQCNLPDTALRDITELIVLGVLRRTAGGGRSTAYELNRLALGDDVLKPYKAAIGRWLWPDAFKNQVTSVAKAKKALADYKKAVGAPEGLAELMVFHCERASGFSSDVGLRDEVYFDALVRMFDRALKAIATLPEAQRSEFRSRLDEVRRMSHNLGYGVGDEMDDLLAEHGDDG